MNAAPPPPPRLLVAGIGNIFLGDDAFGSHVAQRLLGRAFPRNVCVIDFGIRGFDLIYALLEADIAILIDAAPLGETPGSLHVLEPALPAPDAPGDLLEAHSMDPARVLRSLRAIAGPDAILPRVLLVACEPSPLDAEEMQMEMTAPVAAAVEPAAALVESLVAQLNANPSLTEVHHAQEILPMPA